MSFFVENKSKEFVLVPPGSHLGRCYRIIDLGTQQSEYMGETKFLRKIMIGWEIHGEAEDGTPLTTERGEPMAIFKNYTLSWGDKATLRKDLQSWRGKPWTDQEANRFDLKTVLGVWCMLSVIHRPGKNGKTYANVETVSPVPAMIRQHGLPEGFNELQLFRLAEPDWELYETFGRGLKAKIELSPEYRALGRPDYDDEPAKPSKTSSNGGVGDMDDDIPF